jgi:cyclopropane fatty-acyl-phospholipid synthase-like methyltransferase
MAADPCGESPVVQRSQNCRGQGLDIALCQASLVLCTHQPGSQSTECLGWRRFTFETAQNLLHQDSGGLWHGESRLQLLKVGGDDRTMLDELVADRMNLESRVRFGPGPGTTYDAMIGRDLGNTKDFMAAMHANALPNSKALLSAINFGGCRRILDIGCGAGTYSVGIAEQYPSTQCDLVDLPAIVSIAEHHVRTAGVQDRLRVSPANYLTDAWPVGYDAILLLAIIHQEAPPSIEELLRKAAHSLKADGRLILSTFLLEESRTSPIFSVMFSLEMLTVSPSGRAYTMQKVSNFLSRCGFTAIERHCLTVRSLAKDFLRCCRALRIQGNRGLLLLPALQAQFS